MEDRDIAVAAVADVLSDCGQVGEHVHIPHYVWQMVPVGKACPHATCCCNIALLMTTYATRQEAFNHVPRYRLLSFLRLDTETDNQWHCSKQVPGGVWFTTPPIMQVSCNATSCRRHECSSERPHNRTETVSFKYPAVVSNHQRRMYGTGM